MPIVEEKFIISLERARQELETADHLTYITFPLIKENRLLLKILEKIYISLLNMINAVLQYEYMYKRITLYKDAKVNLETFKRIAVRYNINEIQLKKILEILKLGEKHKTSSFEFAKNDKVVIMSNNLETETINLERVKSYLIEVKDILRKIQIIIKIK